jgi:hypothetical protein
MKKRNKMNNVQEARKEHPFRKAHPVNPRTSVHVSISVTTTSPQTNELSLFSVSRHQEISSKHQPTKSPTPSEKWVAQKTASNNHQTASTIASKVPLKNVGRRRPQLATRKIKHSTRDCHVSEN